MLSTGTIKKLSPNLREENMPQASTAAAVLIVGLAAGLLLAAPVAAQKTGGILPLLQ